MTIHSLEYNTTAKILHWLIGGLILGEWLIGATLDMTNLKMLHIQIGALILVLVIIRLAWRLAFGHPAMDPSLSKFNVLAVIVGHLFLYFLMFMVPLLGLLLVFTKGVPITLLGLHFDALVAQPWSHDTRHFIKEVHSLCAATLVGTALVHGLAAIVHYIKNKTILQRITPRCIMNLIEKK